MDQLYEILGEKGAALNGKHEKWGLPKDGLSGSWMRPINGSLTSTNGYHLYRLRDLIDRLGPAIYEAEWRGEALEADTDVIVREARLLHRLDRWNDAAARAFAADCAEHVLPIFERQRVVDGRPRRAIEVARLFVQGRATEAELAAAWSAARAAMTAELSAVAGDALAAVRAAVLSAVVGPAWSPRFASADAARAAREAAAWSAALAAAHERWGATEPVARALLRDSMATAWTSAEEQERAWQTERLLAYLTPERVPDADFQVVGECVPIGSVGVGAR